MQCNFRRRDTPGMHVVPPLGLDMLLVQGRLLTSSVSIKFQVAYSSY